MDMMRRSYCNAAPKTAFYLTDGSGRDGYIAVNNGGMTISRPASLSLDNGTFCVRALGGFPSHRPGTSSRSVRLDSKFLFYRSDGSGRDTYVA